LELIKAVIGQSITFKVFKECLMLGKVQKSEILPQKSELAKTSSAKPLPHLLQHYLGHRNTQHTVRYNASNPAPFEQL
jgi:hypothetical protein